MKTSLTLSTSALLHNVRAIQQAAGSGFDLLAVIKADAYGHGVIGVAQTLADAGVAWLGVSDLEEGMRVRQQLGEGSTRLLVMVGMEPGDATGIVRNGLTPVVWTADHVTALERAARAIGQRVCVHVEVDTGMSRQGAAPGPALAPVLARLQSSRWVECEGLMTHFAESEASASPLTAAQRTRFEQALAQTTAAGLIPKWLHAANSSAVDEGSTLAWIKRLAKPLAARPMVRPGYSLYGHCLAITSDSDRSLPPTADSDRSLPPTPTSDSDHSLPPTVISTRAQRSGEIPVLAAATNSTSKEQDPEAATNSALMGPGSPAATNPAAKEWDSAAATAPALKGRDFSPAIHPTQQQGASAPEGPQPRLAHRLKPVLTWKTCILDVREIPAGASVGYGATFTAPQPMRLALLPVGYADGFRRAASSGLGNGWVMIRNQRAPVVGRVSMNLTVVDITAIPSAGLGDEATLLGPGVTAEDHATWANTIGYEILCGIRAPVELR